MLGREINTKQFWLGTTKVICFRGYTILLREPRASFHLSLGEGIEQPVEMFIFMIFTQDGTLSWIREQIFYIYYMQKFLITTKS